MGIVQYELVICLRICNHIIVLWPALSKVCFDFGFFWTVNHFEIKLNDVPHKTKFNDYEATGQDATNVVVVCGVVHASLATVV